MKQWICTDKFTLFSSLLVWTRHMPTGWVTEGWSLFADIGHGGGNSVSEIQTWSHWENVLLIHWANHLNKGKRGTRIMWVGHQKFCVRIVIFQPFKLIHPWKTVFKSMLQVSLYCTNEKKKEGANVQIYMPSPISYSLLALWNTWKTFVISVWLVLFFNKNSALVLNRFSTLNKPDG